VAGLRHCRDGGRVSSRSLAIGAAVLIAGGLLGGGMQVAEPVFGLPNEVTALGAPWLVSAFAVGAFVRRTVVAGVAGALLLTTGTVLYYAALVVGYGRGAGDYATVMTVTWGTLAGAAGGAMAVAGSAWRTASGTRGAVLGALPAAALAGEAALLSLSWRGGMSGMALALELLTGVAVLVVLSRRRVPVTQALASAVALAFAFAVVEAEVRDLMRAAGWHGA
jgi:hypothetical protein